MAAGFEVPIIIVGFGHSDDIVKCLNAIALQRRCPKFEVFICENGGPVAYDALIKTLAEKGAPCDGAVEPLEPASDDFARACRLLLAGGPASVTIAEARDNGGYAGGSTPGLGRCSSNRSGPRSGFSIRTLGLNPMRWRSSSPMPQSEARAWSEAG